MSKRKPLADDPPLLVAAELRRRFALELFALEGELLLHARSQSDPPAFLHPLISALKVQVSEVEAEISAITIT